MGGKINIIHRDCEPSFADDKSLPLDSYLVSYNAKNRVIYDVVQGMQVDIFDHYYDEYGNLLSMKWTNGRVNPKLYNEQRKMKSKK